MSCGLLLLALAACGGQSGNDRARAEAYAGSVMQLCADDEKKTDACELLGVWRIGGEDWGAAYRFPGAAARRCLVIQLDRFVARAGDKDPTGVARTACPVESAPWRQ